MSSQKGNVTLSRPQKHQNTFTFKNDKFDKSVQTKTINAKLHDGVCQPCKEVLEWSIKYSKYKPLSKPNTCVKCSQKAVKDSYHIMCRPCAYELQVCAKCGKKEDIVIPFNKEISESSENQGFNHGRSCKRKEDSDEDFGAEADSDGGDGDTHA
ncbi:uncharacterized protein C9orf85 homolog [Meriones unguiculatus]|uniref:uncharacterized protein C9orf85 homolog n=1 Tax=Meriones unguiculatus TaxID=10047 RepID=UPI00293E43B0|nr:uncharacterized protein C9orf85 homolog [Meriones unguiculatus]